ncbi:unnamed protein product [Meganyctiphanes norvegica]|uniref:legumain n=1 Tax=Meganyctiphanes norvegica TaxID=48144 RepID=A0AAV2QHQ0_MEGNR
MRLLKLTGVALMSISLVTAVIVPTGIIPTVPYKEEGELWALLVAGSSTWQNYRHQADLCHAYQILHAHGVPDDHIIVMMEDDIAYNKQNPTQGVIVNRPGGPNVYSGIPKDYTGVDVTYQNFLKILQGDEEGLKGIGTGKVIKSGPSDRIFVNMVDHGAPGIFGFPPHPNSGFHFLKATDLIDTINSMHKLSKYKKMVIYLESCQSGSMFQNLLPDDMNVLAVTASNAKEMSFACYLDDTLYKTYLGDVFSVKWMEDTDREDITIETLKSQYALVQKEVNKSHVLEWGDLSLNNEVMSLYLGSKKTLNNDVWYPPAFHDPCLNSSVASGDVALAIMEANMYTSFDSNEANYWSEEIIKLDKNRNYLVSVVEQLILEVVVDAQLVMDITTGEPQEIRHWDCYYENVQSFHDMCFDLGMNPYGLQHLHTLVNLCEHGFTSGEFTVAAKQVCTHPPFMDIF